MEDPKIRVKAPLLLPRNVFGYIRTQGYGVVYVCTTAIESISSSNVMYRLFSRYALF